MTPTNPYHDLMPGARNTWLDVLEDDETLEQRQGDWERMRDDPAVAGRYIERQVTRGRWKQDEAEQRFKEYGMKMEKGRTRGQDRHDRAD